MQSVHRAWGGGAQPAPIPPGAAAPAHPSDCLCGASQATADRSEHTPNRVRVLVQDLNIRIIHAEAGRGGQWHALITQASKSVRRVSVRGRHLVHRLVRASRAASTGQCAIDPAVALDSISYQRETSRGGQSLESLAPATAYGA